MSASGSAPAAPSRRRSCPEVDGGGEGAWQPLTSADELVQFYDPTDLFGDLAEALADHYPGVAPEFDDDVEAEDDESGADQPEGDEPAGEQPASPTDGR